jgi:toxin-antitoxin system PIN domain toxin
MTSFLIDINVWLAMTWDQHPQHASASHWYDSTQDEAFWFCRFTMLGFLRLLTNSQVMGDSTRTISAALELYDEWKQDRRIDLAPEPPGIEPLFRRVLAKFANHAANKAIADSYLVAFAEAGGAHLVTFDRGLAHAAQSRRLPVTLLKPQ